MYSLFPPIRFAYLFLLIPFTVFAEINYEPNNKLDDAQPIHVGDFAQKHKFDYMGDEDWLIFYAKKGTTYEIKIESKDVAEGINPAFTLFDETRKIEVSLFDIDLSGKGFELLSWKAPSDGFYYINVINKGSKFNVSSHYTAEVFIANAPWEGQLEGNIIDQCTRKVLGRVTVGATNEKIDTVIDTTLGHKNGVFNLPLSVGYYTVSTLLPGYLEKVITGVKIDETKLTSLQIELLPIAGCPVISTHNTVDLGVLKKEAIGVFDEVSGILTLKEVRVGDKIFKASLQKQADEKFKLISATAISNSSTKSSSPAFFNFNPPPLVEIPKVFAYDQLFTVQLKETRSAEVYSLEKVEKIER
ncbi:MAG: carboxypeptidase regulatory-like domain-containing protein [Methylococcales bacterium]|nr:carboxypeptidase regulatory-like domain-containing protein [Methylococcales bacterium]